MLRMEPWRWAIVAATALALAGYMGWTISRMLSRPGDRRGAVREASAFESGLFEARVPPDAAVFDGWSYRVPARFMGRVRVLVDADSVSVAGPRVSAPAYGAWIWAQGLLLALAPAGAVWALLRLDWRPLPVALELFVASWLVSSVGAAALPSLAELELLEEGRFPAVEFPRSTVRDVAIGEGWARGGLEVVVLPYVRGVDALAKRRAVSFFAPDGEGREVRYAVHLYSDEKAEELAGILGETAGAP